MRPVVQAPVIAQYINGGYAVTLHADGTKVREQRSEAPPVVPEHLDLKITDWCDAGCAWCHEQSTPKGVHGDVDAMLGLLAAMPAGGEVAIGGGDPLSHPHFERLVRGLASYGLVPSVTVNGRHFERHRAVLERLTADGVLYGVGFSYHDRLPDWDYEHLVVHLIAGVHSPAVLDEAKRSHKILMLGYKQFGRGKKLFDLRPQEVQRTIEQWYRELFVVAQTHHLSFDNLAIAQLKPERLFKRGEDYQRQFMGEEGSFGMYVDGVTQTFALSSYSPERSAWSSLPRMFAQVRQSQGLVAAGAMVEYSDARGGL